MSRGLKFPQNNGEQGKDLSLLPLKPSEATQRLYLLRPRRQARDILHAPSRASRQAPHTQLRDMRNVPAPTAGAHLAVCEHQGQTHGHSSRWSPTLHRFCGIPLFPPSLLGALCPAPHQPCQAWRQAALPDFCSGNLGNLPWCFPE